jgi:hypothetical protein
MRGVYAHAHDGEITTHRCDGEQELVVNQIVSSGSIVVDSSNGVSRIRLVIPMKKLIRWNILSQRMMTTMEVWCTHAMSVVTKASRRSVH